MSSRKRRYSEIDESFQWRGSGGTRRRSEGNRPARDRSVHDWRARGDRGAGIHSSGHQRRSARDRRPRDHRTQNRAAHYPGNVSPKRRRVTDERTRTRGEETPLGYMALKEICESKSPEDGILDLQNKEERLKALLQSQTEIGLGMMKLLIRALHLCCLTKGVSHHADHLLRLVIETNFLQLHLCSFLSRMLLFSISNKDFQPPDLILRLSDLFLEMLKRFGREIVHSIPSAQLSETFDRLKNRHLLYNIDVLQEKIRQVKALQEEVINEERKPVLLQEKRMDIEPPDNFRDISVIPQAADLSVGYKPFLRVNVINRRYRDLEHYLDVQFRLLREDCVLPLREGVVQLRKDYGNLATSGCSRYKTAEDVYVYRDVAVLYPACSRKGMVYRIRFDSFHYSLRHVNWEKSKRLKFGTLLCLSADDFYTLLFATVENRDPSELQQGELEVRFENVDLKKLNRFIETKKTFDMVESPAFFEAYRHVLEALQEIKSPDGLPFQEHIVRCSKNVKPPQLEQTTGGDYDMTGIVQDEVYDCGEQASVPLDFSPEWGNSATGNADTEMISSESIGISDHPGIFNVHDLQHYRHSLEFNDSQLRAFQMALTKRFAVIQGPPGTGKTYVGLKIARVLLQTSLLWENEDERTPMLMISYTNHALDQFLEGLLPMPGIVRVGRRSKSSKLEPCLLTFLREQARESKEIPGRIARARTKAKKKMRKISESGNLELSTTVLKFSQRGVLSFHVLKQFMSEPHAEWFERDEGRSAVDVFCDWLGVERSVLRKDFADRDDYGFDNEDFQRQFSLRTFANEDDVEEDDCNSIKPSEVVICDAEETSKPAEVRRNLQDETVMSEDEEKKAFFLQRLTKQRRWELYRLWLARAKKYYLQQLLDRQPDYEKALARLNELVEEENFHVLQKARVIGMTTTCAARNRRILQRIRPQIVLVEEAAEVLEAHIITSLTKECQHLILIGDHQQLRPNPAVYELATKYKLDVSLFERMVNVGIPCEQLSVQHRMRPEIAALLRHIYEDLENHESVELYEDMKGLKKNLFFIDHCHLEKSSSESHSHTNEHEARFLVSLCRYLLQQGYKAEQLTILTTYMGQMFSIRDCIRDENDQAIRNVRVTTVDNFQGEENDIILLSLVRSNKEEKVGFIKIVNRACVALSRAKMGFYCIGNFDLLSRHSDIWSKIVSDLKASSSIGNALPLECQIHHTEVFVKTARDFRSKVPHGGCQRPCKVRLKCGHACKKLCHPDDIDHEVYRCGEPCHRTIKGCTHLCPKLCCEECEKYCRVLVEKTLPLCGHVAKVCCGKDPDRVTCTTQCKKTLPCGHRCQEKCGKPCTKQCRELVKKCDWPCRHDVTVACSAEPTDCPFRCLATLECSHQCSGACGECRMGRVHKRCGLRCGRVLVCSHVCREACVIPCPPCPRSCENRCVHSECRPKKCGEPCVPCLEKCPWQCRHYKCSKLCGDFCDRPRCNKPCLRTLSCGSRHRRHVCRGLCGEPCICEICHSNDGSPITEIFFGTEDETATLFVQLPDCKHIFAAAELDRYMDASDESSTGSRVIKLKPCPRCNAPIRTSLRYGNVIKQQLQDIEKVKIAAHGHPSEMTEIKDRLLARLNQLKTISIGKDTESDLQRLERSVNRMAKGTMAVVTENQVTLMERVYMLNQRLAEGPQTPGFSRAARCTDMKKELEWLRKRFMSAGVTERELRDINVELTRQKLQLELLLLQCDIRGFGINLKDKYTDAMEAARKELASGKLLPERRLGEMLGQLGAIRQNYRYLSPLTEEEKKEILSAMNLSQGRWYKCPRGHVYSIGGCGQAMQRTTCPECRLVIGGTLHQLFEGNTRASEMEGTGPGWV